VRNAQPDQARSNAQFSELRISFSKPAVLCTTVVAGNRMTMRAVSSDAVQATYVDAAEMLLAPRT
jgi:hypothetical protein